LANSLRICQSERANREVENNRKYQAGTHNLCQTCYNNCERTWYVAGGCRQRLLSPKEPDKNNSASKSPLLAGLLLPYYTHGHKLRFPPSKKAEFLSARGI
jgi:hypothetical protein